jgi:hypothetical protein
MTPLQIRQALMGIIIPVAVLLILWGIAQFLNV